MVTGSAGYIGSNLCKKLIQSGYNIVQIDKVYGSDILKTDLRQYTVDCVVHLAAISSIGECQDNKEQAIRDNVLATVKVSEYAKTYDIPVIFASSQAIKSPDSSVYAMTKFIGEEGLKHSNEYSILRFANVFGGDNFIDEKTSVIAKFIRAYDAFTPLTINGTGEQTRDFVHVDDICKAIIYSIESEYTKMICDVGTGIENSILDVAKMFNCDVSYDSESGMVGVESNVADTKCIYNHLGFVPGISIKEYIKRLVVRDF